MCKKKVEDVMGGSSGREVISRGGTMIRILLMLLMMCMAGMSHAVTSDTVYLLITPVFNLSVNISSTTNTFGTNIPLGTSVTICVGNVMNDGNVTSAWQKRSGNTLNTTAGWTLQTSGTPGQDQFRLLAVTTGVTVSPDFTSGSSNRCIVGDHQGLMSVTSTSSELVEAPSATVSPSHATGETKNLWVSIMMPTNVTGGDEQTVTLEVKAIAR